MNEQIENQVYKKYVQSVLSKDRSSFCPFRKEKQMDYLFASLKNDFVKKGLKILDACSGYGRLIHFLYEFDALQMYHGVDYMQELIDAGRQRFAGIDSISFEHNDILLLAQKYDKAFDITINYKTLYCLPYYESFITELIKVTKSKIYITSPFYDGDIDFITKMYVDASSCANFNFLNTYSFPKFKKFCFSLGVKEVKSTEMRLDIDLPQPINHNVLQTYTQTLANAQRLEITGNIILDWRLIELVL